MNQESTKRIQPQRQTLDEAYSPPGMDLIKKQDRETRSMAVPEVTIYNLSLKPQAFSFECLYLKKTTGNLSIYVPQK